MATAALADLLLAPIDAPTLAPVDIARHCRSRTNFLYLNPFSGIYVSLADWPKEDSARFRFEGKGLLTLLFALSGDVELRDTQDREWLIAANSFGVMYRAPDSTFRVVRRNRVDLLTIGLHLNEAAARQEPFRYALQSTCGNTSGLFGSDNRFLGAFPIGPEARWHLLSLESDCRATEPQRRLRSAISVLEIMGDLVGKTTATEESRTIPLLGDMERLFRGKAMIEAHFSRPLTVADVAREAAMSETKFKDRFREAFGEPPMTYLAALRIEQAKKLLARGEATVSQIAWAVGYAHPCNFAVAFKRHTGLSPKDYRRTAQTKRT